MITLEASGDQFAQLRDGFRAKSSLHKVGGIRDGKLTLPEVGPIPYFMELAVVDLIDTRLFDGVTAPLTASETHKFADVMRLASEILVTRSRAK